MNIRWLSVVLLFGLIGCGRIGFGYFSGGDNADTSAISVIAPTNGSSIVVGSTETNVCGD